MSPNEDVSSKLSALLSQVDDATRTNELSKAAALLREASQLAPQDEDIKRRWVSLQQREAGTSESLTTIRTYVESREEDARKNAIQALSKKQLTAVEASEAFDLLLGSSSGLPSLDEVLSTLLSRQIEVRRLVARKITTSATEAFEQLSPCGDESFRAFTGLLFDKSLWPTKDAQETAQQDLFRLCIASLIDAGVERPDRLMKAVARQLAVQPENVVSLIDEDVFDIVLSELDIRHDNSLRSQAMVAMSRLLEVSKEDGEKLFANFVSNHVGKKTNDDLIMAFSAASSVFPVLPAVASKLFLTEGFVQGLIPHLERNSEAAASGKKKSKSLEQAALELLSAACVDKSCRELIRKHCSEWLQSVSEERNGVQEALAALVLAKINENSVDKVTDKLSGLVMGGDNERDQAVEGLAYTSLQPKVKEKIASNNALLTELIAVLKDRPTAAFGALTVLSNLTAYRKPQSEESKRMSQLKAYANSSKPAPEDPLDDDQHVTARCKIILDKAVVPALVSRCKQSTSPAIIALVVRILLSLAKEQKHRASMTQQGATRLLLQIIERTSQTDKSTSEASLIERTASHALARLLISINPAHVFTSGLPATSAVSSLIPLLTADHTNDPTPNPTERDLLPTFETLLALTNLASMPDSTAADLLTRSATPQIEDLLFSTHPLIQRATVELLCNLMAHPSGVSLFVLTDSADAKRRLHILFALTTSGDLGTRRAAGGALAMLTEWDLAQDAVVSAPEEKGVKAVLALCGDEESEEVRHRGFVCLSNLVQGGPGGVGEKAVKVVRELKGQEVLTGAIKRARNPEVLRVGVEVMKVLV
ncbi:ARM repeat-containing protein [Hortaea werneckii]|nr:ARM repeat-containing protein [Hortaea werneckii]KAI6946970.1 ARM repeat-containing protein [Hortaea werneckii]